MSAREKQILKTAIRILRQELNPKKIFLFGSRAKGTSRKGSDFDLALDCPAPSLSEAHRIREKVSSDAGLYKVDLVYLRSVSKTFRDLILSTGKVIYAKGS